MGWAPIALAVASTVSNASAAYRQGQQQQDYYNYQSQVAANNAIISKQNADYETQRGEQAVQIARQKGAQVVGAQRAAFGAANVDPNYGSAARAQGDTAGVTEAQVGIIRNDAARRAYNAINDSNSYVAESRTDRVAGTNAATSGRLAAMGSLLSGSSSVADKWYRYKSNTGTGMGGGGTAADGLAE